MFMEGGLVLRGGINSLKSSSSSSRVIKVAIIRVNI